MHIYFGISVHTSNVSKIIITGKGIGSVDHLTLLGVSTS